MQLWASLAGQFKSVLKRWAANLFSIKNQDYSSYKRLTVLFTAFKSVWWRVFFIRVIFLLKQFAQVKMRTYRRQGDLVFSSVRVWFRVSGCISDAAAVSFFTAANLTSEGDSESTTCLRPLILNFKAFKKSLCRQHWGCSALLKHCFYRMCF